jgi:hypothetical protein
MRQRDETARTQPSTPQQTAPAPTTGKVGFYNRHFK